MIASPGAVPLNKLPTTCRDVAFQRLAISCPRVSSGKQATEERGGLDRQAAAFTAQLVTLRRQPASLRSQPTGRQLEQAIRQQVEEFIGAGLADPLNRQRFNAWLLSRGVRITATDPKRNRWEFSLDGIATEARGARGQEGGLAVMERQGEQDFGTFRAWVDFCEGELDQIGDAMAEQLDDELNATPYDKLPAWARRLHDEHPASG